MDKVQKIREEVARVQLYTQSEVLKQILDFIDSLQEEPAPKIFEDMLNAITPAESLGISAEEHEKIIDLCLYGKELEMVDIDDLPKEEPVSEDLEKEISNYLGDDWRKDADGKIENEMIAFAKHFFELGLKVQKREL